MNTTRKTAGALVLTMLAGAAAAQPGGVQGDWIVQGGQAKVRIAPCAGQPSQMCGQLINPKTGAVVKGEPFITGFKPAGPNRWGGGKIRNPQDGKTYNSKMALNADGALAVSGCVLVVCKAQTWKRAPQ